LSKDHPPKTQLRQDVQEWEILHREAVETVGALIESGAEKFKRRVATESVLLGTVFL